MTGGEAVARSLHAHGVDTVFGIPGVHNLALYDALCDIPGMTHIVARHEQGAAFMADGYARVSGRVGVCVTTSGPAVLNTVTSLGTAYCDSSPVLCITSQIPKDAIGLEKGFVHECRDQLGCLRPVACWCERAETVESIPELLRAAFLRMRKGRPRPAVLEIPCDVLDGKGDVEIPTPGDVHRKRPSDQELDRAVELLRAAKRPLIWAGGGVIASDASDELRRLAEQTQAPVLTTVLGKGAIPGDHPLAAGNVALVPVAREYVASCDVMLAVGTRFTDEEADRWTLRLPKTLIHIDIDPEEIDRNYPATLGLVGDARESLGALVERVTGVDLESRATNRAEEVAALRKSILEYCSQPTPDGVQLVETLRDALPRQTVVVSDLTIAAYWCRRLLDVYEPHTNVYPWGFCTLGFGVPAGVGAKAAQPNRPVVVISGDGGFLFNCQELAIAAQFDLPIVVVIFNDSGYGVLRRQQEVIYGRTIAAELMNPDFVTLARSFNVDACRVSSLGELGTAVAGAIASGRTSVIEAVVPIPWQAMDPSAEVFAAK